jgi:hypothetical protein
MPVGFIASCSGKRLAVRIAGDHCSTRLFSISKPQPGSVRAGLKNWLSTAERRQEFPGIPNDKCAFVALRGLAASYQSEVIAGDTWQSGDLWQCSRPFQSRFPPARGVPEYRRIKDILGHLKSAVAWAIEPIAPQYPAIGVKSARRRPLRYLAPSRCGAQGQL